MQDLCYMEAWLHGFIKQFGRRPALIIFKSEGGGSKLSVRDGIAMDGTSVPKCPAKTRLTRQLVVRHSRGVTSSPAAHLFAGLLVDLQKIAEQRAAFVSLWSSKTLGAQVVGQAPVFIYLKVRVAGAVATASWVTWLRQAG